MLSGRYRTEALCRFWSANPGGYCLLNSCRDSNIKEDVTHILTTCPSLSITRARLKTIFISCGASNPTIKECIDSFLNSQDNLYKTHFLLDCSTIPDIIRVNHVCGFSTLGLLFKLTRTWCYALHRERLRLLGRWSPFS